MYDYLVAQSRRRPDGRCCARKAAGGPLPTSGYVPVGIVLDPRTVGYDTLEPAPRR